MMFLGVLVGLGALWTSGWDLRTAGEPAAEPRHQCLLGHLLPGGSNSLVEGAAYIVYFAVAFFALRWWRLADPRRPMRFSFLPLFAAAFWSLLPLAIWPQPHLWGVGALVMTAAIVQLVSPWDPPPPPNYRRLRLRYSCQ